MTTLWFLLLLLAAGAITRGLAGWREWIVAGGDCCGTAVAVVPSLPPSASPTH